MNNIPSFFNNFRPSSKNKTPISCFFFPRPNSNLFKILESVMTVLDPNGGFIVEYEYFASLPSKFSSEFLQTKL